MPGGVSLARAVRLLALLTGPAAWRTMPRRSAAHGSTCSCFSVRFLAKPARRSPLVASCSACYQNRLGRPRLPPLDMHAHRPWGRLAAIGSGLDPPWGLPVSFPPARANRANLASRLGAPFGGFSKGTSDEMGRNSFEFVRRGRLERLLATILRLQLRAARLYAAGADRPAASASLCPTCAGLSATALLPAESVLHALLASGA